MAEIDNSLENIASKILDRAAREFDGWHEHEDQDLAFNLAAMFGMLFPQLKADREALVKALAKARTRIAALHRKIGELVEAQGGEGEKR